MKFEDYEEYRDHCNAALSDLQDSFKKVYDIESYPEWHYDDGIGIFQFKSENKNLYFRYVNVGSFSRKSQTWKWSWDKAHTSSRVKQAMEKVKAFGKENSFEQLTTGLIDGDKFTGWGMTAISQAILSGFGAYRIVTEEDLEVYFIFTSEVDDDQYKELRKMYVECKGHGLRRRAFICQHLTKESHLGFHEPFPTDPDTELEMEDDYEAWCDQCEAVRAAEGEWNDRSEAFAKIKLYCVKCFFEIKDSNCRPDSESQVE